MIVICSLSRQEVWCVCVCVCVCLDIVKVTEQKLRCCYELLAKLPGTDTGYSVQIKVGTALQN